MSRFYTDSVNERNTTITKCGRNYLETHTRGWNYGIKVICTINERGNNEYRVYKTGGSNDSFSKELIHEYQEL